MKNAEIFRDRCRQSLVKRARHWAQDVDNQILFRTKGPAYSWNAHAIAHRDKYKFAFLWVKYRHTLARSKSIRVWLIKKHQPGQNERTRANPFRLRPLLLTSLLLLHRLPAATDGVDRTAEWKIFWRMLNMHIWRQKSNRIPHSFNTYWTYTGLA